MESRSDFIVGLAVSRSHIGCVPYMRGNQPRMSTSFEFMTSLSFQTRFTDRATDLFSITWKGGRSSDFSHQLEYDAPINDCRRVLSDHFARRGD
jgi:hypothetical protein